MNASILLLPGDGIGPEVVGRGASRARRGRPRASVITSTFTTRLSAAPRCGAGCRRCPTTRSRPRATADAILLGAVGDPAFDRGDRVAPAERRCSRSAASSELYANLRPARVWPGLEDAGPLKPEVLAGTDMLVVRELTGGLYYGEPRGIAPTAARRINTMRYSRDEIERIARVAFDARAVAPQARRPRSTRRTCSKTSRLWRQVVTEVGARVSRTSRSTTCTSIVRDEAGARAVELRRHPHREHVRRHPVRRGRRGRADRSACCRQRASATARACSSRCTARRPTSRERTSRIRSARSRRPRCCCATGCGSRTKARAVEAAIERALAAGLRTADLADRPAQRSARRDGRRRSRRRMSSTASCA